MKFRNSIILTLFSSLYTIGGIGAFAPAGTRPNFGVVVDETTLRTTTSSALQVSIGLGPDAEEAKKAEEAKEEKKATLIEPDHELFRDSRLTDFDRQCDSWYESLLGTTPSFLGEVSEEALRRIKTLHKLERNVSQHVYGYALLNYITII